MHFGLARVLENVVYDESDHHVDFADSSITENTRGAYPIEFIPNIRRPCVAPHPKHVIFLTCDAFGVLPPGQPVDARAGRIPFHQRLYGKGGRHRSRRHRTASHVLALFRRTVSRLASAEVAPRSCRRRSSDTG